MTFRPEFPDRLADLLLHQPANEPGPQKERDQQGGECAQNGSQGDVSKDRESGVQIGELLSQPVKHQLASLMQFASVMAWTMASIPMERDPFTRQVVPGLSCEQSALASSSRFSKCSAPSPNASAVKADNSPVVNNRPTPMAFAASPTSRCIFRLSSPSSFISPSTSQGVPCICFRTCKAE